MRAQAAPPPADAPPATPPPAEEPVENPPPPATPAEEEEGVAAKGAEEESPPPREPRPVDESDGDDDDDVVDDEEREADEENSAADADVGGGDEAADAEETGESTPRTTAPTGETTEGERESNNPRAGGEAVGGGVQANHESLLDLVGIAMSAADEKLKAVYGGDTIHRNDGCHLRGGIAEATDAQHQRWMGRVFAQPHPLYHPPRCAIGNRFIAMLARLFEGVRARRWNSELPLIFAAVILRKNPGHFRAAKIKQRIQQRLDLWEEGKIEALVTQVKTAAVQSAGTGGRERDEETAARAFNSKVCNRNIRSAVRNFTAPSGGGVV